MVVDFFFSSTLASIYIYTLEYILYIRIYIIYTLVYILVHIREYIYTLLYTNIYSYSIYIYTLVYIYASTYIYTGIYIYIFFLSVFFSSYFTTPRQARHHEWIYGPNYGMLDFTIRQDSSLRPHVTRECSFSLYLSLTHTVCHLLTAEEASLWLQTRRNDRKYQRAVPR